MKLRLHSALDSLLANLFVSLALLVCLNTPAMSADTLQDNVQAATQTKPPVVLIAWQRVGSPLRMDA